MKDYYAILGVSPQETSAGIRAAYRDAVRRTHPDHAGAQATGDFRDVVEAHSVLSDPDRRQEYNEERKRQEKERSERERRDRTSYNMPRHASPQGLSVELILTPQEAAASEVVSVGIPVEEVCRACAGCGWDWLFPCLRCGGEGRVSRMQPIEFRIPQPVRAGLMREIPLQSIRIGNLLLNFHLRVSGQQH
jgi:DnaJ-class molecular chaperone